MPPPFLLVFLWLKTETVIAAGFLTCCKALSWGLGPLLASTGAVTYSDKANPSGALPHTPISFIQNSIQHDSFWPATFKCLFFSFFLLLFSYLLASWWRKLGIMRIEMVICIHEESNYCFSFKKWWDCGIDGPNYERRHWYQFGNWDVGKFKSRLLVMF